MDTKLTLKLDKSVIERAKIYAAEQKVSISSIVENYLKVITSMQINNKGIKISNLAKSFTIREEEAKIDLDYKKELQEILSKKYKL